MAINRAAVIFQILNYLKLRFMLIDKAYVANFVVVVVAAGFWTLNAQESTKFSYIWKQTLYNAYTTLHYTHTEAARTITSTQPHLPCHLNS